MWQNINNTITQFFVDIGDFVLDIFLTILQLLVNLFVYLVDLLPVPDFVSTYYVGTLIPAELIWMLNQSGFSVALAIVASAQLFRLIRSIATLGIWN